MQLVVVPDMLSLELVRTLMLYGSTGSTIC